MGLRDDALEAAQHAAELYRKLAQQQQPDVFEPNLAASLNSLADLRKQPGNTDTQGAMRYQMKKAVEADPSLGDFLRQWVSEGEAAAKSLGVTQTATVIGDNNTTVQVSVGGSAHVTR